MNVFTAHSNAYVLGLGCLVTRLRLRIPYLRVTTAATCLSRKIQKTFVLYLSTFHWQIEIHLLLVAISFKQFNNLFMFEC